MLTFVDTYQKFDTYQPSRIAVISFHKVAECVLQSIDRKSFCCLFLSFVVVIADCADKCDQITHFHTLLVTGMST